MRPHAVQHAGHGTPRISYRQRYLPHPLLTVLLVLLWVALQNSFSVAVLVGAIVLGVAIPIYTANFWPNRPIVRHPVKAIVFLLIVMWDILVANVQVAYLILVRHPDQLRTRWVTVPLDISGPEAIAVLAGTVTLTPGTVSSDISADGRSLLVHCLDLVDEEELVRTIKNRYEKRLQVIFP
jgi:multicomponent K+:H+ antiporter subunit E